MAEFEPIPDPSGALQPPNRRPPTAVGAEASGPDPRPAPRPSVPLRPRASFLKRAAEVVLAVPVLLIGAAAYPFTKKARRRRKRRA